MDNKEYTGWYKSNGKRHQTPLDVIREGCPEKIITQKDDNDDNTYVYARCFIYTISFNPLNNSVRFYCNFYFIIEGTKKMRLGDFACAHRACK